MPTKPGNIPDGGNAFTERQERILDAAEACFVRKGFERTTMQDIARTAEMSSPNIYRYFPSKEALVLGLGEREHRRGMYVFEPLDEPEAGLDAFMTVFERYFAELRREWAILSVEFWLEATRNPALAAIEERRNEHGATYLVQKFAALAISATCDLESLLKAISPLLRGMIISRAFVPDYDPTPALAQLRDLIKAGLSGTPTISTAEQTNR